MSQASVNLIGTLRVSFAFHQLCSSLKFDTTRITSRVNFFRKNSTIATIPRQKFSVEQIAYLRHTSFPNNKLYSGSSAVPISLSYLAASHYFGKLVYCTTLENKYNTQIIESSSANSQTSTTATKENVTSTSSPSSSDEKHFSIYDLFNIQQITFGTSMGFASGYFVKKVSKTAAVLVGGTFILLQVLEQKGYITIYWGKFEENYNQVLDLDKDGKVTTNDVKLIFYKVLGFLSRNFQTDASFAIGFGAGLKYG